MTTIIVVAIVALVFFVAISVAAFMTWRQETQMRTDSLRGIEISLNEVLGEVSQRRTAPFRGGDDARYDAYERRGGKGSLFKKSGRKRIDDDRGYVEDEYPAYDSVHWADQESDIDVTVFRPSDISATRRNTGGCEAMSEEHAESLAEQQPLVTILDEREAEAQITEQATSQSYIKAGDASEPIKANDLSDTDPDNIADTNTGSVDLSFIDIDDLFDIEEILFESTEHDKESDYNTGRSGRKYTAEELESLIKE